jgi:hypothetical protein
MKFVLLMLIGVSCSAVSYGQALLAAEAASIESAWASGARLKNATVQISRGFDLKPALQSATTDATGVTQTSTKYWERIVIHLPRLVSGDHMACLMVNSKCRPLPVGASLDKKNGILYWHVPNAYKGDFDLVFLQSGSSAGAVRVTAGAGSK